jgi:hypothetical protein
MYIISALLIRNYHKKVGGKRFFEVLLHELSALSDEETLQFFKKELNIKQVSDFILPTAAPVWSKIYHAIDNINLK